MDAQDFEMPSPKRQRTDSPVEASSASAPNAIVEESQETIRDKHDSLKQPQATTGPHTATSVVQTTTRANEPDMLDFLMQHVESESSSAQTKRQDALSVVPAVVNHSSSTTDTQDAGNDVEMEEPSVVTLSAQKLEAEREENAPITNDPMAQNAAHSAAPLLLQQPNNSVSSLPPGLEATTKSAIEHLHAVAEANDLPPTADTLVEDQIPSITTDNSTPAIGQGPAHEPESQEWELDSSPYESSTDSSDTSSDSSEDDDEADEYTLLDPYEQARILMAEDGGGGGDHSDDEDGRSRPSHRAGGGGAGAGLRTANEKAEDIHPKPDITVTENMTIEELGIVEAVVETILLVKATISGEYQVLESGSVLCLGPPSRNIIGVVAETLGRVQQPMYTVRFASETDVRETFSLNAEDDQNKQIKGTKIFYIKEHSTFVFTQPLKAVKGSDASNFHDEEVGDDEMEFSDDEAEAEHKRQMKLRRKGIDPSTHQGGARGQRGGRSQRGSRGGFVGGRGANNYGQNSSNMRGIPDSDTASIYSTTNSNTEMNYDDVEDGETSIDYTPLRRPETMTNGQMSPPSHQRQQHNSSRGNHTRGNRPQRGRGNNNNSSRGGGGGGNTYQPNRTNNYTSPTSTTSMYHQPYFPSNPQQTAYFGFQPPPPAPHLTPFMAGTNTVPPSPMTPLPSAGPGGAFTFSLADQAQAQAQNQWAQYHANLQQAQYGATTAGVAGAGPLNASVNAEASAQVQRHLEELRRQAQQSQGQ